MDQDNRVESPRPPVTDLPNKSSFFKILDSGQSKIEQYNQSDICPGTLSIFRLCM